MHPVVMFGDSITESIPAWDLMNCLPVGAPVYNLGIGFDTWPMALPRAWMVRALKPRVVFVLLGVNDLNMGRSMEDVSMDGSMERQFASSSSFIVTSNDIWTIINILKFM